jgi:hypothetical protein
LFWIGFDWIELGVIGIGIGLDWVGMGVLFRWGILFVGGEGVGIWLGVCCVCGRSHLCCEGTFLFFGNTFF